MLLRYWKNFKGFFPLLVFQEYHHQNLFNIVKINYGAITNIYGC